MFRIAVITSIGELHIHDLSDGFLGTDKIDSFVVNQYGNNQNWQQITKTVNHTSDNEKSYIFLTSGGTAKDDGGTDVDNCQYLAIAKGSDVLTAFNNMLSDKGFSGNFNSCFAHELSDDKIKGSFDLSDNIPAECENRECDDCWLSDDVKNTLGCPYINQ